MNLSPGRYLLYNSLSFSRKMTTKEKERKEKMKGNKKGKKGNEMKRKNLGNEKKKTQSSDSLHKF